ncbi:MAG: hypothetical protein J0H54_11735, partial [Rhizobiales bacterium]|nr:hypothetical protein [Hyphomicrobiales bacterium]
MPGWLTLSRPVPRGLLLGIGLVLLFALALYRDIAFSLVRSRLAVPPGYDDVVYLLDAMQRWRFELPHGLGALVSGLISHPPHAPVSTLTGIAGFALFGPEILSAYLANGWILAIYVAAMAVVSRPLGGVVPRLLFVAALLFARVSQAMITEFRPDMAAGLVFALALVAITATDLLSASPLRRAGVAALAVLATVIKPTGAVLVMPGIGVAILATLVLQVRAGRGSWPTLLRALLLPSAVYLLLLTPFAIAWGRETYEYILQTLVTNADIWRTDGGVLIHWTYHLFGYGATKAL